MAIFNSKILIIIFLIILSIGTFGNISVLHSNTDKERQTSSQLIQTEKTISNTTIVSSNQKSAHLSNAKINNINSVDRQGSTSTFSKTGTGNNALVKANETFSVQTSYPVTNSIVFNNNRAITSNLIPTYPNYSLTGGNFNVSNVQSTNGVYTLQNATGVNFTAITSSNYLSVASSFNVSRPINITSFSIYLPGNASVGSNVAYNVSIRKVNESTGIPNGTIYLTWASKTSPSIKDWITFGPSTNPTNVHNETLSKGIYAIVITHTDSNSFNWPVVLDNSTYMWTKTNGGIWAEYPAVLPFYYNYIVLSNISTPLSYSTPNLVDFNINDTAISNSFGPFNLDSTNTSFTVTTNTSVSFIINYFLIYRINSLAVVDISYNISAGTNLWTANYTINALPTPTPPTTLNSVVKRNIMLLNIPSYWTYYHEILNGSVVFNTNTANIVGSTFTFSLDGSFSQGNFKVVFSSSNYVNSLDVLNTNNQMVSNYIPVSSQVYFAGKMIFTPQITNNTVMILQNSTGYQLANFTYPNISIYQNYFLSPLFTVNESFQGQYKVIITWSNFNLTEIGYYEQVVYFVAPTHLSLISKSGFSNPSTNIVQMSSTINLIYNFTNLLTNSTISNSTIHYSLTNEFGQNNINLLGLSSTTTNQINIKISTDPSVTTFYRIGKFNLTFNVTELGFESQVTTFIFSITGFKLQLGLSYNNQVVRGQSFSVKATVSSAATSQLNMLLKQQAPSSGPNLNNLIITVNFNVTLLNNSIVTLGVNSTTNQLGVAYIELIANSTKNIKSMNSISASFDGNEQISPTSYSDSHPQVTFINPNQTPNLTTFFGVVLSLFIITILVIIALTGGFFVYRSYLSKTTEENQQYDDYISSATNFLGMYITTKQGLPVFLKSNQQLEDQNQHLMLSGVTYSIDLFLSNFKEEYTRTISKQDVVSTTNNTGLVNMTVIDQENFKIIIGVSDSYRLYVLIKESNNRIIKLFQNVLDDIEKSIKITRTIINLQQIYPLFTKEIERYFPIELVNEFEIKFDKLIDFITDPSQTLVSGHTIATLKEFSFYLAKSANMISELTIDGDFDFSTLINNSRKIKIKTFTLGSLMDVLKDIKANKKAIYEILFVCSTNKVSIFKNITPISLPEEPITSEEN